jgi:2-dehydro-3-deoxy-D-arabinonate dehydratase
MRLGQIRWNNEVTAAIFEGDFARPVPDHTLYDLIRRSEIDHVPLTELARQQASSHREAAPAMIPIHPREVWGCGGTYAPVGSPASQARPVIFFKGTARNCVGPGKPIGIRPDSNVTIPEPELAVLLGGRGSVLGFTLANDVTAWDLAGENPLYLPQAKIFSGSCALGPYFVTPDELTDPYCLEISCTVQRDGTTVLSDSASTSNLNRLIPALVEYLIRGNPIPSGSVLLTGTGITVGRETALMAGDVVSIRADGLGELSNPVVTV